MIWLHRYCRLLVCATFLLVAAGGMVTSTNSGLSVPDWPTTYGYSMFSFPVTKMVGGIFYEHGHRLIASTVGFLTIGLVVFIWRVDSRRWMRRLALIALGAVILQGVLGGLTVLYFLPAPISIGHASLAQGFFALMVSIALFTSQGWRQPAASARPLVDDASLRRRTVMLTSLVYTQMVLGAWMRHAGAGLAIPDFPLMFGHLLPPHWSGAIALHFAHRLGALVVSLFVLLTVIFVFQRHGNRPEFARPAILLVIFVAIQVTLGALVVLSGKEPVINTLHVANGGLVLVTSVVLTLRAHRVGFEGREQGQRAKGKGMDRPDERHRSD